MAFGFPGVRGEEPPYAGFPSDSLVALYKCDERTGDKLYDATGKWEPLQMATGVALDCTGASANLSFVDSTGLAAAIAGRDGIAIAGCEVVTPSTTDAAKHIISSAVSATAPIQLYFGAASSKLRIYARTRTQVGAGAAALTTWNTGTNAPRIKTSTLYQIAVMVNTVTLAGVISLRAGVSGPWLRIALTGSGVAAGENVFPAVAADFGLLADNASNATPATPFNGIIHTAFCGAVEAEIEAAERLLERPTKSYALEVLGAYGRFWDFRTGTGATVRELTTGTVETVEANAGAIGWAVSQTGCSQIALRQGRAYYGKAGVRMGGETGMVATGGGAIGTSNPGACLGGSTGWTFQVTASIGARDPATDAQIIAMAIAPELAGTYLTDPDTVQGVGIYLSTAQAVVARVTRAAADTLYTGVAGAGNNNRAMGLLSTYTIVAPATGQAVNGFSVYRQSIEDAAPVLVSDNSTSVDFRQTAADKVWVGNASYDADATVGFVAMHSRPLTVAEMAQCHRSAVARMTGEPTFVDVGLGVSGNGSENRPYGLMLSARRKAQPGQIINMAAGTYPVFNEYAAATKTSTIGGVTVLTSGAVIFEGAVGGTDAHYPLYLDDGSWTLTATSPGYFHFLADGASNLAAGKVLRGVTFFGLTNGKFSGGFKSASPATGSGLNIQVPFRLTNVTAYDNDEHGIYARMFTPEDPDQAFEIEGLYCYGNTEDGLKMSNELSEGAAWVGTGDKIRVDAGQNQVWLGGVRDSVFTNLILENQATAGTTAALYFGYASGVDGSSMAEDTTVSNVTIYNATLAVLDNLSTGCLVYNMVAVDCTADFRQGVGGTAVLTYCAGNTVHATEVFPTDPTNIPDSADLALVDPANVTPASRDFHLDEGVDGEGDGVNLTTAVPQAATDYAGDARPTTGAWDMGAY